MISPSIIKIFILCIVLAASLAVANVSYIMRWEKTISSKALRSSGTERQEVFQEKKNTGQVEPTVYDKTKYAKQDNDDGFDRDVGEKNDAGNIESVAKTVIVANSIGEADKNSDDVYRDSTGRIRLSKHLESELNERLRKATDKKIILVWHCERGIKFRVDFNVSRCGNCELTHDRSKITDPRTGAVVFYYNSLHRGGSGNTPMKRNMNQLWIYWVPESPYTVKLRHKRGLLELENSLQFNATGTYRRDSDFYMSYEDRDDTGLVETLLEENKHAYGEILKWKKKFAITFVSNCGLELDKNAAWVRLTKLREIAEIDTGFEGYGACFDKRMINGRGGQFRQKIQDYKFYFAMESCYHCKDYITEKFFNNALKSLSVPVVWGSSSDDYLAVAPAGSFIHADDFPSMKKLVEYLRYLDKNDTAYMEYFKWLTMKPEEMPQFGRARSWCHICRGLHGINIDDVYNPNFNVKDLKRPLFTDGIAKRTVPSLSKWFYDEDNPECLSYRAPVIMNSTLQ